MKTLLIELEPEQQEIIEPILMNMSNGEALIAQVYIDGMRVRVLDAETAKRVQAAIGRSDDDIGNRYAHDAQAAAEARMKSLAPFRK